MLSGGLVVPTSLGGAPKPRKPVLRLSENFFQRWFLIVLPVVVMAAIGFLMSQRFTSEYVASATLSTAENPFVEAPDVAVGGPRFGESTAQTTSRLMTEQLSTDRFAAGVAERAGFSEAIENGVISYNAFRDRLRMYAVGQTLLVVEAAWGDPETSLVLVDAMIAEYLSVLRSTVSADAQSAVEYYEGRRDEAALNAESAAIAYDTFLAELPVVLSGEELPFADQLELGRLNDRLNSAQAAIDSADSAIEEARLSVERAESEAGRSLQIVDPASSSFEPESTLTNQAIVFVAFLGLGVLIALTILLLTTHLDRSVRSAEDIEAAGGGVTVVAVPVIRSLQPRRRLPRALGTLLNAPREILDSGWRAG